MLGSHSSLHQLFDNIMTTGLGSTFPLHCTPFLASKLSKFHNISKYFAIYIPKSPQNIINDKAICPLISVRILARAQSVSNETVVHIDAAKEDAQPHADIP